ncbi:hypothetical protein ACLB90_01120 [Stenotrophomonas sp. LGBM10]|uniref:hypothetical protein n=1 Tax=Stenotrophomonas sp. LGBM10 TaxID=3390038 RepID=UPI00398AC2A1
MALLLLAGASGSVGADVAAAPDAAHYTRVRNVALGAGQPDTLCENILVKRRTVGVHCHSASASLLQALGVSVSSTDTGGAAAGRRVDFATGMAQYTGTPRTLHGRDGFIAEVDCDPGNGPVYRATATCLATVSFDGAARFHYAQLTLRDHTTGTQVLTTDAALAIIDALEQGETPDQWTDHETAYPPAAGPCLRCAAGRLQRPAG